MTTTPRSVLRARTLAVTCAALLAAGALAGCGGDDGVATASSTPTPASTSAPGGTSGTTSGTTAGALVLDDGWVKAAPSGMTALFGVLRNPTAADVTVVSATSSTAKTVELHEVAMVDGAMKMRPKEGGFVIRAGGTHALAPGGDHIMLMGLTGPVAAGGTVTVTLTTRDGATVDVSGIAKDYAGGNESYAPGAGTHMPAGTSSPATARASSSS